jgi:putative MATE family efflux protein
MKTNLVSNGVNIVLNYLLIGGHFGFPSLGIKGAAIATVLGTVAGCVMSIITVFRRDSYVNLLYICQERILPSWDAMKSITKVGYGALMEQLLMRAGFMATAVMAANQGTDAFAAHQVGINILSLSFSFGDGLQSTAIALIGYSLGAKESQKAKEYGRTCQMIGGCVSAILAVIFLVFGKGLFALFFEEAGIIAIGLKLLKIAIVIVVFQISAVTYIGCLRGAGDTLYTAVASTVSITIVRTFISWFCCYILNWGIVGIWMGIWADSICRLLFGSIRFKSEKWMKIKV